jgi:CRP-like cAMP-binding protein
MKLSDILATAPAFSAWPLWARETLARKAFVRHYARSASVLAYGAQPQELLLILKGTLAMGEHAQDGARRILCLAPPGEVMALICVLHGHPFFLDLLAHEPACLLHIPQENLWDVLIRDPRLISSLLDQILRRMGTIMVRDFGESPCQCLERVLWRLVLTHGKPTDQGVRLDVRLSQDDLAMLMSCSRQTVNKEVRRLVEQGVIAKSYNAITIINREWLAQQEQKTPPWRLSPLPTKTPLMEVLKLA